MPSKSKAKQKKKRPPRRPRPASNPIQNQLDELRAINKELERKLNARYKTFGLSETNKYEGLDVIQARWAVPNNRDDSSKFDVKSLMSDNDIVIDSHGRLLPDENNPGKIKMLTVPDGVNISFYTACGTSLYFGERGKSMGHREFDKNRKNHYYAQKDMFRFPPGSETTDLSISFEMFNSVMNIKNPMPIGAVHLGKQFKGAERIKLGSKPDCARKGTVVCKDITRVSDKSYQMNNDILLAFSNGSVSTWRTGVIILQIINLVYAGVHNLERMTFTIPDSQKDSVMYIFDIHRHNLAPRPKTRGFEKIFDLCYLIGKYLGPVEPNGLPLYSRLIALQNSVLRSIAHPSGEQHPVAKSFTHWVLLIGLDVMNSNIEKFKVKFHLSTYISHLLKHRLMQSQLTIHVLACRDGELSKVKCDENVCISADVQFSLFVVYQKEILDAYTELLDQYIAGGDSHNHVERSKTLSKLRALEFQYEKRAKSHSQTIKSKTGLDRLTYMAMNKRYNVAHRRLNNLMRMHLGMHT